MAGYKWLSNLERDFRSIKADGLDLRPIWHRLEDRVRAHVLICMHACYLTWHLRQAWALLTLLGSRGWSSVSDRPRTAPGHGCGVNSGIQVVDAISVWLQGGGMPQRRVAFVVFDGFQALDLAGPHEVFQRAGQLSGVYQCQIVAPGAGLIWSASGLPVHAAHDLASTDTAGIDTLMVAGGPGVDQARHDQALVSWIAAAGGQARRVSSVCSGVFLLAAAGLAAGRRVTTHWSREEQLAREYPELTVDCDPIFIRDGRMWTSAGVTAGMDLALALVEDDLGRDIAHAVAQELVLFLRRPGSQSQFSMPLWTAQPASNPIRAVVSSIHADPGARHGLTDLACQAGLSPRHLQRRFTVELGIPPAAYVERVRIEAAQRALAQGSDPVETIARRCGFGTAETLRRAFHRRVGVAPSDYRERFRSTREQHA